MTGESMMRLAKELWPINRSLSGEGVRETLATLRESVAGLRVLGVPTGTDVQDWSTPKEWNVEAAYIVTPSGEKICDFSTNNLHLVGYSTPFEGVLSLEELEKHLYSLKSQPNAIPYVTSYYKESWGFCLTQNQRESLEQGSYRIVVKSKLFDGVLNYGEILIPGASAREVFFSTYICHPSMANNELSGPVLAAELAKFLQARDNFYSYRFVFIPETIGSLMYMSMNLERMKRDIVAGYVLTCVGDDRAVSYLPSRNGNSVADRIAIHALSELSLQFKTYSWLDRGSDERQYCSPGADLPVCSVMRSKYGTYPEYHTSLDTLGDVVTAEGLQGSFDIYKKIILELEDRRYPIAQQIGEPQLGRRDLYPTTSIKGDYSLPRKLTNVLSFSDGQNSEEDIAARLSMPPEEVHRIVEELRGLDLVRL